MIVKSIVVLLVIYLAMARSDEGPGKNEEYRCDVPCEKSCTTRDILIKCVSEQVCKYFCKDGYFRDERNGKCVLEKQCPDCGINETYKSRGITCATCENHTYVRCEEVKKYMCYCLPNHVRNAKGICTPTEKCPAH